MGNQTILFVASVTVKDVKPYNRRCDMQSARRTSASFAPMGRLYR